MMFSFPPPDKPWSTNKDRTLNQYERAALISTWKGVAQVMYGGWCAKNAHTRALPPSLVRVHIPFTVNRRRDPHNYCGSVVKAIIDGMVNAGAWPDDTPNYVEHLSPVLYKGDEVKIEMFPMRSMRLPCEHGNYDQCGWCTQGWTEIAWT